MTEQPVFRQSDAAVARVKETMLAAWNTPGAGYQEMAETLKPASDHMLDVLPVRQGMHLLDAATGTGVVAIEAARRGARVDAVDFAPDLVAEGQRLAVQAGQSHISFRVADIEALPYADGQFDAVASSFGMIFAPRHDLVVWHLARVIRPGGTLTFTSWVPEGPNYCLMTITAPYTPPPPPNAFSVLDWGRADYVHQMLSADFSDIQIERADVPWHSPSPSDAFELIFNRALGPTVYAFHRLSLENKLAVHNEAIALFSNALTAQGTVEFPREYLLVRATRRA